MLENELSSFSNLSITSPTSQLFLQPFHHFTYITAVEHVVACALVTQRARVRSPVGTSFLGEGFSSPVRQMSGSVRPTRSPNIIWPSLSSSLIIHYGRQWPEMLTSPKTSNIRFALLPLVLHNDVVVLSGRLHISWRHVQQLAAVRLPKWLQFSAVILSSSSECRWSRKLYF